MPKNDLLHRLLDSGMSFTAMSQARAEAIVKDLVKQGTVRRKEAEAVAAALVDRGRESAERIAQLVEEEVGRQVARLAAQIDELETRLAGLTGGSSPSPSPAPAEPAAAAPAKRAKKAAPAAEAAPVKRAKKAAPAAAAPAKRAKKAAPAPAKKAAAAPAKRAKKAAPAATAAPVKRAAKRASA